MNTEPKRMITELTVRLEETSSELAFVKETATTDKEISEHEMEKRDVKIFELEKKMNEAQIIKARLHEKIASVEDHSSKKTKDSDALLKRTKETHHAQVLDLMKTQQQEMQETVKKWSTDLDILRTETTDIIEKLERELKEIREEHAKCNPRIEIMAQQKHKVYLEKNYFVKKFQGAQWATKRKQEKLEKMFSFNTALVERLRTIIKSIRMLAEKYDRDTPEIREYLEALMPGELPPIKRVQEEEDEEVEEEVVEEKETENEEKGSESDGFEVVDPESEVEEEPEMVEPIVPAFLTEGECENLLQTLDAIFSNPDILSGASNKPEYFSAANTVEADHHQERHYEHS